MVKIKFWGLEKLDCTLPGQNMKSSSTGFTDN